MARPTNRLSRRIQGIKRARKVLRIWRAGSYHTDESIYGEDDWLMHHLLNTRARCSCPFCGNSRRHFNQRTKQELLSDIDMHDQIIEPAN